jgi:alkylation response protein AidB-like acyl-CoA dehydrogenase
VVEADGTKRVKPNGTPEIRTIVFPATSATMYDVWDVIGLSGTGTDSYSVDNLFIPEKFAAQRDNFSALRENGPLYGITTFTMFGLGFAAISLGVARGMLDAAIELARGKASVGIKAMRDNHAVQGLVGRTEGNWRAARAYIYGSAAEAWRDLTQTGKLSEEHRAALRLASTWTIHQAAAVVDAAYHMAGATAVFRANKFERRFRDMHAIAQQIQGRDTHYEDVGRMILTASAIPRGPTA